MQELAYALAGKAPSTVSGRIRVRSCAPDWLQIAEAERLDIPLVPADRGREGIVAEFSVAENMSLSVLGRLGSRGKLSHGAEGTLVGRWTGRLEVKASSPAALISTLSGGNQQKVVLGRCLARDPELLVLSEPTAGVDIGTRVAIYDLIAGLARDGLTVVVSSSDVGDLLAMCTRIVVLRDGQVAAELGAEGLTEHALVRAMEGEERVRDAV
jgi:ribose transport system ATP-binding protein